MNKFDIDFTWTFIFFFKSSSNYPLYDWQFIITGMGPWIWKHLSWKTLSSCFKKDCWWAADKTCLTWRSRQWTEVPCLFEGTVLLMPYLALFREGSLWVSYRDIFEPTCAYIWWALKSRFLSVWMSIYRNSLEKIIYLELFGLLMSSHIRTSFVILKDLPTCE